MDSEVRVNTPMTSATLASTKRNLQPVASLAMQAANEMVSSSTFWSKQPARRCSCQSLAAAAATIQRKRDSGSWTNGFDRPAALAERWFWTLHGCLFPGGGWRTKKNPPEAEGPRCKDYGSPRGKRQQFTDTILRKKTKSCDIKSTSSGVSKGYDLEKASIW